MAKKRTQSVIRHRATPTEPLVNGEVLKERRENKGWSRAYMSSVAASEHGYALNPRVIETLEKGTAMNQNIRTVIVACIVLGLPMNKIHTVLNTPQCDF